MPIAFEKFLAYNPCSMLIQENTPNACYIQTVRDKWVYCIRHQSKNFHIKWIVR